MQYLSERLHATNTGKPRGEKEANRETVAAQQRRRLLAATERLIAERGCAGTTIERIAKQARVSSITFYDHFAGKEEAFVAAFDEAAAAALARLASDVPTGLSWPEQVREGLRSLLVTIAANPERATMCLIESQKGGPALLARYEAQFESAVSKLSEGRLRDEAATGLPERREETTAAGIAWLLREQLETVGAEGIEEMLPRLVDVALTPYLGSAEALHVVAPSGTSSVAGSGDEPTAGVVRLPPGRHGLTRDAVSESQRERLLNGVVDAVVEHGYNATTIAQLTGPAWASRRTFYEHFADKEECFLAAYEMVVAHVRDSLREAGDLPSWPDRVRAALATLLRIFAADPTIARFLLLESLAAGGEVAARHRASLRCIAELLRPAPPGAADALAAAREP